MTAFSTWLSKLSYGWVLGGIAVVLIGFYFLFNAIPRTRHVKAQLLCVVGMDLITLLFFILTYSLRVSKMAAQSGATPRTLPRLWALLMLLASIGAYVAILKKDNKPDKGFDRWIFALLVGLGSIVSVLLFQWIGYYLSSAIFIVVVMVAMGEKSKLQLILTPIIWCVFTYFVFNKLLFISLPVGSLFKGIF
ncbi:MAG: tripartite tricarboxylate transporter TctB family protein [Clostridia bacterium]|nr:tripartite tricarboxylate transporter TctB family protein [Clostridia bacterium]